MYGIRLTSVTMTLIKFNPFLLAIGLFSTYMTYSGKKAIDFWRLKQNYFPGFKDRLPFYIAFVTSILMICLPIAQMVLDKEFRISVLSIFGIIMLLNSYRDIRTFSREGNFVPKNKIWIIQHIGMMGGAYISTLTAFLVVNVSMNPDWLPWLIPTIIGTPMIFRATAKWKLKLKISKI